MSLYLKYLMFTLIIFSNMTDQDQQPLDFSGQELALLLKQTILTFCQMNVAYKNKLEVSKTKI